MPTVASEAHHQQLLDQLIGLLIKVHERDRARFARAQLSPRYHQLVKAFDQIRHRNRAVLFASVTPHSRESRLAAAARLAGWEPFSVCIGTPRYEPAKCFSFHTQLDDPVQLTLACWLFPGALVHAFALSADQLVLLDRLKPRRLVIDLYDTCAGSLANPMTKKNLERDIIGHVDAITHRDVRIKRLQRLHGYKLPQHNLLIHDPLPEVKAVNKTRASGTEIHVVSTGWIGSGSNSIVRIARALCTRGIHLHVYLNPFQNSSLPDLQPYFRLKEETPFFHLEESVYGESYWEKLQGYDFGLSVLETAIFGEKLLGYTQDAMAGCGSSRLSDYIAAGLGVIISPELQFQYFWARRYADTLVEANLGFLANPLPALKNALSQRRAINRTAITISGTAQRLGAFYEKVANPVS